MITKWKQTHAQTKMGGKPAKLLNRTMSQSKYHERKYGSQNKDLLEKKRTEKS